MNIAEFSGKILELKKSKKYEEALRFFRTNKKNFPPEAIANDPFLVNSMITILRKSGNSRYIDLFLQKYSISLHKNTPSMILNAYNWYLLEKFEKAIENKSIDYHSFLHLFRKTIPPLLHDPNHYNTKTVSFLLRNITKSVKKRIPSNYAFLNEFLDIFDPKHLQTEPLKINFNEKSGTIASDREFWYFNKTLALYHLNMYKEAITTAKTALKEIEAFHNKTDIWLLRLIGRSYEKLGKIDIAIDYLQKAFKKKREWYIQKELANLYIQKEKFTLAKEYLLDTLTSKVPIEYKIEAIELLGDVLYRFGDDLGCKHYVFVYLLRQRKDWKISEALKEKVKCKESEPPPYEELLRQLSNYWQEENSKKFFRGKIVKILHDNDRGIDGFIATADKEYYFSLPSHIKWRDEITLETEVTFLPQKSDRGYKATNIRVVKK